MPMITPVARKKRKMGVDTAPLRPHRFGRFSSIGKTKVKIGLRGQAFSWAPVVRVAYYERFGDVVILNGSTQGND